MAAPVATNRCVDSRAIGSLPGELRWEGRGKGLRVSRTVVLALTVHPNPRGPGSAPEM